MSPTLAVGAVVLRRAQAGLEVLLVRRGRPPNVGSWTFPGGRVEAGETLAAAVVREVKEETGLAVTVGGLIEVFELLGEAHHYVVLDYAATVSVESAEVSPRAGDDAADVRWQSVSDLEVLGVTEAVGRVTAEAAQRFGR